MSSSDKENEEESSEKTEEEESSEKTKEEESSESKEEEEEDEEEEEEEEEDWATAMRNGAETLELHWKELCNQRDVRQLVEGIYNIYTICIELLKLLQTFESEARKSAHNAAMYHYFAGRIVDALPFYNEIAETQLLRAVIINPEHSDAWRCLANSYAKKPYRIPAKICIDAALKKLSSAVLRSQLLTVVKTEISINQIGHLRKIEDIGTNSIKGRRPEKEALCKMSLLAAWLAQDDVNGRELIEESIRKAHQANELDKKDGYCWYALGRAYQCYFLQSGEWDLNSLQFASHAYEEANKDEERKIFYTDLIYQWALVDTALENYERALIGFTLSVQSNPALDGTKDMNMMIRLLDKLDMMLKLGTLSTIHELMKDAAKFDDPAIFQVSPSYEEVTMDLLFGGHNKGFAVLAKVLYPVNNEKVYPLYYVLCDTNLDCFVLTVHGIHAMAIQRGDVIILLDPYYSLVNFEWQGKLYHFKSVRVNLPNQVLVNGEAVPNHFAFRQPLGRKPKAWGL